MTTFYESLAIWGAVISTGLLVALAVGIFMIIQHERRRSR